MLKIDLHLHAHEDLEDEFIKYSAKELVDRAIELKFDAISLTFHSAYYYPDELVEYANERGLLLISGSELRIEGSDVLVYNISKKEFIELNRCKKSFEKFRRTIKILKNKNKNIFVIAPHPYFILPSCVGDKLIKYSKIFDAVEFSWFHSKLINLNKKGIKVAKELGLPIIANSDTHFLDRFGLTYSLVDANKNKVVDIFQAISENKIKIVSKPINIFNFFWYGLQIIISGIIISNLKKTFNTKTIKKV